MPLVCLKCETRVGDEHTDPCPNPECGAREWVFVEEPKAALAFTKTDRDFLRVNRIGAD